MNDIRPCRLDHCSECGGRVQRTHSSADEIVCHPCRRLRRALAEEARRPEPRMCPLCKAMFVPRRSDQRYCSGGCRMTNQRTNWTPSTGNPKYKSREHRRERAKWAKLMDDQGYLLCAQDDCLMPTRIIQAGDKWHLGHDSTGTAYIGPTHARCNVVDGAKRGNLRSRGLSDGGGTWVL